MSSATGIRVGSLILFDQDCVWSLMVNAARAASQPTARLKARSWVWLRRWFRLSRHDPRYDAPAVRWGYSAAPVVFDGLRPVLRDHVIFDSLSKTLFNTPNESCTSN